MLRRIIHLYRRNKSEFAFANVNDSEKAEAEQSNVYEKRFFNDRWWTLLITGAGYLGVGIYAIMYPAEQVFYKIWLPISFFTWVGTVFYYIYNYNLDKMLQKQQQEAFKKIEQ